MKLVLLFFLLMPCLVQAQKFKNFSPANLDSIVYDLVPPAPASAAISLPFKKINIIDSRYDTTKLGYACLNQTKHIIYKDFRRIMLKKSVAAALEDYYNQYYGHAFNDSASNLLIVIKKLWIDNLPDRSVSKRHYDIVRLSLQDIHIKMEFYLEKEHAFFPIKRVDTIFQLTENILGRYEPRLARNDLSFMQFALRSVIETTDFRGISQRLNYNKKLTAAQIDSFNNKRFRLPVLEQSKIAEGVFMNFNEFVNNSPSVTAYTITKLGVIRDEKDSLISHNAWGFNNKEGLHWKVVMPSKMWRNCYTYEFFVTQMATIRKSNLTNMIELMPYRDQPVAVQDQYETWFLTSPRQIDMETGEIY